MKGVIISLLLVLVLSNFVVAGSEVSTNFVIENKEAVVEEYTCEGNLWINYIEEIIGILVFLILFYIIFKMRVKVKSKAKKKVRKAKRK